MVLLAARGAGRQQRPAADLVCRAEELSSVAQLVRVPPAVAVVEGEAGIGKTRLVAELRLHPAMDGRHFLVGTCQQIREPFPLGPVIEAVSGLADERAGVLAGEPHLSPVIGALRPLLPELAGVLPPEPAALTDRAAERHRVYRALAEFLGVAGPAVLVLEDLHWADERTVDLLGYLLRNPPPELSLVLTYRSEEAPPGLRAMTARRSALRQCHLLLPPLDAAQTGELAAAILGLERVSGEFAAYLCERASGLPFVIEELLSLLQAKGSLVRRDGSWARRAIDDLQVPAGVRDPVLERLSRLNGEAGAVAEAAAVLQVAEPVAVVLATSLLARTRARRGLDGALAAGLLVDRAGLVGFRHALAAEAVYGSVPAGRREELHGRAAAVLGRLDPPPLARWARHLRRAGRVAEWVVVAERAADRALQVRDEDEAARLLADVLRIAPLTDEQRGGLAIKLGDAARRSEYGRQDAIALMTAALDRDLPGPLLGELRMSLALLQYETGAADALHTRRLIAAALPDLAHRPDLAAQAMLGLSFPNVPGTSLAELRQWLRRLEELLPALDEQLRTQFLGKVAMVKVGIGDPRWQALTDPLIRRAEEHPGDQTAVAACQSIAAIACCAGHLMVAERLLSIAERPSDAAQDRVSALRRESTLRLLDFSRGRWDGLETRTVSLLEHLSELVMGRSVAEMVLGGLAMARGDLAQASARLAEIASLMERWGDFAQLSIAAAAQIRLAICTGDIAGAAERAGRLCEALESAPFQTPMARALPALSQALVLAGSVAPARNLVGRWRQRLQPLDAPLAAACLPHAEGFLAAAASDSTAACRWFVMAGDAYRDLGFPYEEAQAREQAGRCGLRAADLHRGATELQAAMRLYQRLGAGWDMDRASATARQYGLPVPARHRRGPHGYGTGLSPRERQVAELAACGRTNQQIAAELLTTVSTVKKQLAAAMRKLGAPSRATLADRLAGQESVTGPGP